MQRGADSNEFPRRRALGAQRAGQGPEILAESPVYRKLVSGPKSLIYRENTGKLPKPGSSACSVWQMRRASSRLHRTTAIRDFASI
jgi:hypothetical protein